MPSSVKLQPSNGQTGTRATGKAAEMEKRAREALEAEELRQLEEMNPLAADLRRRLEDNKRDKIQVERRMLRSLNMRQRVYEPEDEAEISAEGYGSKYYSGLTGIKCRSAEAWMMDVILPVGDRAWGCDPTPIPELDPETTSAIESAVHEDLMIEAGLSGFNIDPAILLEIQEMVIEEAKKKSQDLEMREAVERARAMENLIEDQMVEGGWHKQLRLAISDFVTFPAAVMVAPLFRTQKHHKWERSGEEYVPKVEERISTRFLRVSPFDVYPQGDATSITDGDLFLRMPLSVKDLNEMKGVDSFSDSAIDMAVEMYNAGGLKSYLPVDQARLRAEGRPSGTQINSTKIESWWYYGSVRGSDILKWASSEKGRNKMFDEEVDYFKDYEVSAILVGNIIIKLSINRHPLAKRPVHKACYEEVPGAFWGNSIPDLLHLDQIAANQIGRAIQNNAMMASGFMMSVNNDQVMNTSTSPHPMKVYLHSNQGQQTLAPHGSVKPVEVIDIPIKTSHLLQARQNIYNQADEDSGVPAYSHGDANVGGAGNTSSGLQMLMNASAKLLRMAIFNFDVGIVQPVVEMMYHHNMIHHPDPSVKGDLKAVFRGSSQIIAKEMMATRQREFADATNNPTDAALMGQKGRLHLLRELAKSNNLNPDDVFPPEVLKRLEAQEQSMGTGGSMAQPGMEQDPMLSNALGQPAKPGATTDLAGMPLEEYQKQ